MRILVHIGVPQCGAEPLQAVLDQKREKLLRDGVLYSSAAGRKNHTRLYMAVTDPDHVDPLRIARGFASAAAQDRLRHTLSHELQAEAARHADAGLMVISAPQLATLPHQTELERLRSLLTPISEDITILAHIDEQARVLLRHYAEALREGRLVSLTQEMARAETGSSWDPEALTDWRPVSTAARHTCPEIQGVPHWLDYCTLVARWQKVFGADKVILRPYDADRFGYGDIGEELPAILGVQASVKPTDIPAASPPPSAVSLARWRQVNIVLDKLNATGRIIPRPLYRALHDEVSLPGPPHDAGGLSNLSKRFETGNGALRKAFPALTADCLKWDKKQKLWSEPDPGFGFRATQYVAAVLASINEANVWAAAAAAAGAQESGARPAAVGLTPTAERLLSDPAKEIFRSLQTSRMAPHNRIGALDEAVEAPAYSEIAPSRLPEGSTGKVIVGCMKNEAPFILEWIAYHRQIGVDNFLIYTNDCSDGTDAVLDRLQDLGIVQHLHNNEWKGKSPQQHALNKAMREDLVRNAEWLIHIDVDEFINVRVGNGTLDEFLALVPHATNVAMTWRLFGHNRVEMFEDRPVIAQFDRAAPKFCPKPHTSWGFKTMTRNIGAYAKLSCHRPNKLDPAIGARVQWVNGSGAAMAPRYHEKGWRSDVATIGYDLLQLNHYALRSAESFLVKRQRGRALHVDRSIGLNYWIRMDWCENRDVTIKRNVPRLQSELDRLLADAELRRLHAAGVAWHKAKAAELHGIPEFEDLYAQILTIDLTDVERAAFSLALDIDN